MGIFKRSGTDEILPKTISNSEDDTAIQGDGGQSFFSDILFMVVLIIVALVFIILKAQVPSEQPDDESASVMEAVAKLDTKIDKKVVKAVKRMDQAISAIKPEVTKLSAKINRDMKPDMEKMDRKLDGIASKINSKPAYRASAAPRQTPRALPSQASGDISKKLDSLIQKVDALQQTVTDLNNTVSKTKQKKTQPKTRIKKPDKTGISEPFNPDDEKLTSRLCLGANKKNYIHFLSNQVLIKLLALYPDRTAIIDLTLPHSGRHRFKNMPEGTRRPFEYNEKPYFFELLKVYRNCAVIAVYERKRSNQAEYDKW